MTQRIRVMLADDHEAVRQGLRALFAAVPEVEVVKDVGDVDAALAHLRADAPDLIVLDLSMPKASGLGAIRRIKEARLSIAVVVLTRHRDLAFVQEALTTGASAYVLKQSSFDELRRAVLTASRGDRYIDGALRTALAAPPFDFKGRVTHRELDVLRRTVLGQSNKEIAAALQIAVKTVEVHKANAMRKLDLPDRSALIRYAVVQGWLIDP